MKNCRFNKHTHTIWIYSITINNNEPKSLIPFRERSTGCPDTSFVKLNPGIKRVNNVFRLYFRNVNFICIGPRTIRVSFTKRLLSWWRWVCCFRVQSISFFFYFSLILLLSLIVVWIDSSFFFQSICSRFSDFSLAPCHSSIVTKSIVALKMVHCLQTLVNSNCFSLFACDSLFSA